MKISETQRVMVYGVTEENTKVILEESQALAAKLWPDQKLHQYLTCSDRQKEGGGVGRTWIIVAGVAEEVTDA